MEDWIEGLAAISEQGIHGDIKPGNLVLRRKKKGVEGAIIDFNSYHPHGKEEYGFTTSCVQPPEYCAHQTVSAKQDVWALGLCLHELFAERYFPCWSFNTEQIQAWTSQLVPGWALQYPVQRNTPPFVQQLIHDMLDPRLENRPAAQQVSERFSAEFKVFSEPAENGLQIIDYSL